MSDKCRYVLKERGDLRSNVVGYIIYAPKNVFRSIPATPQTKTKVPLLKASASNQYGKSQNPFCTKRETFVARRDAAGASPAGSPRSGLKTRWFFVNSPPI